MVVDHHPEAEGVAGYSLEIFLAVGDAIVVTVVPESAIKALRADQIPSVRPLTKTAGGQVLPSPDAGNTKGDHVSRWGNGIRRRPSLPAMSPGPHPQR